MEHKTKINNKIYKKLFTMLLACSLLLAGIPSAVLAEAPENLIGTLTVFDPTFETGASEDVTKDGAVLDEAGGHGGNGTHNANGKSLKLPVADNKIFFMASVEPSTNYTFSFWMKNSVVDSLQMPKTGNYFFVMFYNGSKVDRMVGKDNGKNGNPGVLEKNNVDWNHTNFAYFVNDTTFGSAHTEEADINTWRPVSINFTTPYEAVDQVHITLACAVDDPHLAVDDLSLVSTGKAPNRIFNGELEALRYDKETAFASNFGLSNNVELTQLEDGTYCFKTTSAGTNYVTSSPSAFFFKGKKLGTRYKISMKYKPIDETYTNNKAFFRLRASSKVDTGQNYGNLNLFASNGWNTYTMYVDATKAEAAGTPFAAREVWFNGAGKAIMDDFYSGRDESNIGFYKELEFAKDNGDPYYDLITDHTKTYTDVETEKDVLMFERSIETPTISALPENVDGSRTVKVRAHFLPEPKWRINEEIDEETGEVTNVTTTVSHDETEVTLLSAVYKYEKNESGAEIRTLHSLDVENGTSANGKTIDVVDEVIIPATTKGVRYEVEAMAWDENGLMPVMKKAILGS